MEKITQFEFDNMMNAIKREHEERASALRKELQALNEEYKARKEALKKAFPNIKGVRKPGGSGHNHELHALRANLIKNLREGFKDDPRVDADNINVHFRIEGENVTFETIIPKK